MNVVIPQYSAGLQPVDISDQFSYDPLVISNFKATKFGNIIYLTYDLAPHSSIDNYISYSGTDEAIIKGQILPNGVLWAGLWTTQTYSSYVMLYDTTKFIRSGMNPGSVYPTTFYYCFQIV